MKSPAAPWVAICIALFLSLGALREPFVADDFLLWATFDGVWGSWRGPWTLFNYFPADPDIRAELMDSGVLSWWAHPDLNLSFWRPLASVSHWFDFAVFGPNPVAHHAHNLVWYVAMLGAAVVFFRQLIPTRWVATCAAVLFAFEDVHGIATGWIASRNLLMATALGALAVAAHDRWRKGGGMAWGLAAPTLLGLSVLSAEAGISMLGYIAAYALCIERGPLFRRLLTLMPAVGVAVVWRLVYQALGYGVVGSGHYLDPVMTPIAFVARLVTQIPVLVMGHLAASPLDGLVVFPEMLPLSLLVGVLWFAWMWAAFSHLIKGTPLAQFFLVGMVITAAPLATGVPQDRLLTPIALGGFGLIALCLQAVREGQIGWGAKTLGWVWIIFHGLVSPLAIPPRSRGIPALGGLSRQITDCLPDVAGQDVVLLTVPFDVVTYYAHPMRMLNGGAVPGNLRALYSGFAAVELERTGERTIVLTPEDGFLATWRDRILRGDELPFLVGDTVRVAGLTVQVLDITNAGRPARVQFTFDAPLDTMAWRFYDETAPAVAVLPDVGDSMMLPAFDTWHAVETTTGAPLPGVGD
jgi:hypothetical protein